METTPQCTVGIAYRNLLLSSSEAGFLMGCSCGSGRRPIDAALFKRRGLTPKHAYSLLDVRELPGNHRVLRLRNPWGQFVWRGGAWAEDWDGWTPELKAALPVEDRDRRAVGGTFWMSFADFVEHFDSVDICKVRIGWKELRLPGILPARWTTTTSRCVSP